MPLFTRAEVSVWPIVIDAEAKPRDLLEYSITIKNSGQTIARLYPIIRDISENGDQDEANSLAGWIEIPRGRIELLPGEEKEIPFFPSISILMLQQENIMPAFALPAVLRGRKRKLMP